MAINKKLIHFKRKVDFLNQLFSNNILDTSICFIQDANLIYTHGTYYNCTELLGESYLISNLSGSDLTLKQEDAIITAIGKLEKKINDNKESADDKIAELAAEIENTVKLEFVNVVLETNQSSSSDLEGAVVTLTLVNDGTTQEQAWAGNDLLFEVPAYAQYTITFSEVTGYKKPSDLSYTAIAGNSKTVTGTYNTTVLTVNLTTNQSSHGDVAGKTATVKYDSKTITVSSGDTVKIPYDKSVTVTPVSNVTGYSTPSAQTFTTSSAAKTVNLIYSTTIVTVVMADNQSSYNDISGCTATVAASGITTATISSGGTVKVPTGVSCTITWSALSGYKKPDNQTFTTSGTSVTKTGTYQTQILTVNVTTSGGGTLSGYTVTISNVGSQTVSSKTWKVPYGTSYTVSASDVTSFVTPSSQSGSANSASKTITMTYVYNPYKITVIRVNQTVTDPASMVTSVSDEGAVTAIRNNSHRYLGKYTATGTMTICQLDDTDSTKYADGASAILTGSEGDVWMKLPQFYWKCTQYATDKWDIYFAYGGKPDNTYNEWTGNDLIGVYEAYSISSKLYSRSGVTSSGNISQADFKTHARNRGTGFSIVKWKHHCMMAALFYAHYKNTNSQAVCGSGTDDYQKTTGATNSLGMEDTTTSNGNSMSINFWGLENWWGNKYEWIDNVVVDARSWKITEDDSTVRTAGTGGSSSNWISKMLFGTNMDMIPTTASGSETTGFCDYYYQSSSSARVVARSCYFSDTYGGVVCVDASDASSDTYSSYGSRASFTGTLVTQASSSAFKALSAIS